MTVFRATDVVGTSYPSVPSSRLDHTPATEGKVRQRRDAMSAVTPKADLQAQAVQGKGPASPKLASTHSTSVTTAKTNSVDTPKSEPINEIHHPVIKESKPFLEKACDVRYDNKKAFEPKRSELRKAWPGFDKVYDDYRRWRDSPEDKRAGLEQAGKAAQKEIMQRAGLTDEQMQLFKLLSDPESPLLRFVSPINGDFRAPKEGVIAGLRDVGEAGKTVPTLTFPGTGAGSMIRAQLRTNYQQFSGKGGVPAAYDLGLMLAERCRDALKNQRPDGESLVLSGHSLGGGIASYVGARIAEPQNGYQPRCYLFNPAALGGKVLAALNELPDLAKRVANQKIIRVKNDHVSSPAMQERLTAMLAVRTLRRIVVPRHLGKIYVIPREMLDAPNRNVVMLHSLESLRSVFRSDRQAMKPAHDTTTVV